MMPLPNHGPGVNAVTHFASGCYSIRRIMNTGACRAETLSHTLLTLHVDTQDITALIVASPSSSAFFRRDQSQQTRSAKKKTGPPLTTRRTGSVEI